MGERVFENVPGREGAFADEVWLLGQPPLHKYLNFVKDAAVGGAVDRAALCDEWREANDYYHELEQRESGIADEIECRELDPSLAPLAEAVKAHASYRRAFDELPTTFSMVELDKLVVCQRSVTDTFVKAIAARLGKDPTLPELFRFALPIEKQQAPVQIQRVGSRRYVFRSDSTDFRYHEAALLEPRQLRDYEPFGPIAGVVGIVVGYGSNFLNAVRVGDRLLLQNGYHRACALRSLGITHAPCIVQTVTRGDELALVAKSAVVEEPDFYFRTARPPLLKDFFDPNIRKVIRIRRQVRMIEVSFEIRDFYVSE